MLVNLAAPGAGLVLLGRIWEGVGWWFLFAASINLAVAGSYAIPETVGLTGTRVAWMSAAFVYIICQWRYVEVSRQEQSRSRSDARRRVLNEVQQFLEAGEGDGAWRAAQPLLNEAQQDVYVAFLMTRIHTLRGDLTAAREAWAIVRRLDRHRVYRDPPGVLASSERPSR